jgi:hypothetical protein
MSTKRNPSIDDDETLKNPERKKLRFCEPDLKITVGGDVDGSDAVDYWYHSSVMATHSNYIDTMLASGMKESCTYEVSFPDIPPATWESMMKFLEQPLAVFLMTAKDVMEVAQWYDQFDFPRGRQLSGHILTKYLNYHEEGGMFPDDDFDFFIDAILLADALGLDEAKNAGVRWIQKAIFDNEDYFICCSTYLIAKLAPLIAKEDHLFKTVKLFVKSVVTKDDILDRLFPEMLVKSLLACCQKNPAIKDLVTGIIVSGSRCNACCDAQTKRTRARDTLWNRLSNNSRPPAHGQRQPV